MHRPTSALDVLMYRGEAHPKTRTTMVGVYLLDREPRWRDLVAHIDRASRLYPCLRERVVEATTSLIDARWVTDPHFDLAYHLRRLRAPAPGTFRDVLDLVEATLMTPLDTTRPLWEFTLVGGVDGDRAALITKLSHAITDGVGGMQLQSVLFDTEREPPRPASVPAPLPVELTPIDITLAAVSRLPRALAGTTAHLAGNAIADATRSASHPLRAAERSAGYLMSLSRLLTKPAPPSPLLARRSNSRRVLWTEVPLDELKRAAKASGGTVNDAYLAALAGALSRYHHRLDAPIASVSVAVPVSRRVEGAGAGGNAWAPVSISLPIDECDAAARIRSIGDTLRAARSEPALDALAFVAPLVSRLPPAIVYGLLADLAPRADVQASNVPGWPIDTYICGSKVERFLGFGPLPGAAMMAVLISSAGNCTIGVNYDPAAIERPDLFQECLDESLDEVLDAGRELVKVG